MFSEHNDRQTSEVPPSTIPESAEQGQALEAVSWELHSEEMFSLLVGFSRDLSHSPWCHDIFETLEVSFSCLFLWLSVLFTNKITKGNSEGNLIPCSFHNQT